MNEACTRLACNFMCVPLCSFCPSNTTRRTSLRTGRLVNNVPTCHIHHRPLSKLPRICAISRILFHVREIALRRWWCTLHPDARHNGSAVRDIPMSPLPLLCWCRCFMTIRYYSALQVRRRYEIPLMHFGNCMPCSPARPLMLIIPPLNVTCQ